MSNDPKYPLLPVSCSGFRIGERFFESVGQAQLAALVDLFSHLWQEPEDSQKVMDAAAAVLAEQKAIRLILDLGNLPPKVLRQRKRRKDYGTKHGPRKKPAPQPELSP